MDMATAEIRSLNDVLCEMTGYSHRELIRKKCYEILSEDSRKDFFMALVKLHSHEKIAPAAELEVRKKDGTIFPAAFTTRYHYKFGQLESATVVVHDITRRKQIEREKQLLQMQLFRAQKMEAIGTLAGGIAHDFNNLLMAIQGHVSLMTASTDYLHPYLKHFFAIENYIKSAADLTRKLLGFAQGKQNEKKSVRLNTIVNEQIHIFVESRKDIQIHAHYEENLWPTVADSIQVKQVVLNLILNAIQAMPEGGHLHVRTRNRLLETDRALPKPAKPGRYVALTITDTGIGMDTETQQRIFEPFFTTKTMGPQKGSGLGLATAYGIVQNHGGFITVDSKPQEGSAFTVFLPATSPKKNDPATSRPKPATKPAETVLAIDSESEVLEALEKMLNRLGYQILKATSGRHALELVHKNNDRVDLVILDAGLPDFNRRQLMVELKKINPNVRILPAGHMDEPATKPAEAGGFLRKPFSLSQLSKELQAVLG
jgi:PAS domain S-box-containing protein